MIDRNVVWEIEGGGGASCDSNAGGFLPEHVGNMINPLDLPPDLAVAIFGEPLVVALSTKEPWVPGHFEIVSVIEG